MQLLILATLTTALFYLGSRAQITSFLWRRYPTWLARFVDCPACIGFWHGLWVAATLRALDHPLPPYPTEVWNLPLLALASVVWTPLGAALLQRALEAVGSAVNDPEAG